MIQLDDAVKDKTLLGRLFGENQYVLESKRKMIEAVWKTFKEHFWDRIDRERICLISVPNRVELLGKHTDYQGGSTFLLTGPKNFFAISALSKDGVSELLNADPSLGTTVLKLQEDVPYILREGVGAQYTSTVARRLKNNLSGVDIPPLREVKSVFMGDIPFGGGTSGSSAKLITDFLIFSGVNGLLTDERFYSLIISNGRKAGLHMGQRGVEDFQLALSMYLAHHENGFDFGDLKGDRGVGTFGGSEDHTAILLGRKDTLLHCRYCPTEVLETVEMFKEYTIIVAYSGKKAEKTKEAMAKYNRLSEEATSAVGLLNAMNNTKFLLLRDFFQEYSCNHRAQKAWDQLWEKDRRLAERAFQFYKEEELIGSAIVCLKKGDVIKYGRIISESHEHSLNYLKNIVPEIDFLQKTALQIGACGASGFGGGFGGSCYAVVANSQVSDFQKQWKREYIKKFPLYKDHARFDTYPACSGHYWEIMYGE